MLLAVLLVAAALVVAVVVLVVHRRPSRLRPSAFSSNAQWAAYYRDLAEDARRSGDERSEVEYTSLAATYEGLNDAEEAK